MEPDAEVGRSSAEIRVLLMCDTKAAHEELRLLQSELFPRLRRHCRARGVEFTEIDLHRGTEFKHHDRDLILRMSLEEIRANRPIVIGLLGGDDDAPDDGEPDDGGPERSTLLEREIEQGVLAIAAMRDRALFYVRGNRTSGGTTRSARLRDRIRRGGIRLRDHSGDAEAVVQAMHDDLLALVDREIAAVPTAPLERERNAHETFAAMRRSGYVPRSDVHELLNRHADRDAPPMLILGPSGAGKSALIAGWTAEYRARRPEAFVIAHYVGASSTHSASVEVVRRIAREIAERAAVEVPADADELMRSFPLLLAHGAAPELLLIVDGLDQLADAAGALAWLPPRLPRGVRAVLTSTTRPPGMAEHECSVVHLRPLSVNERIALGDHLLAERHLTVAPDQVARLVGESAGITPLALRVRLEEMRLGAANPRAKAGAAHLAAADGLEQMFERLVEFWAGEFGEEPVRALLTAIWGARYGLTQEEARRLVGCSMLQLAEILAVLDNHVVRSDGRLRFYHDALRRAVERRYLPDDAERAALHRRLAEFFDLDSDDERGGGRAEDVPWQLAMAGEHAALRRTIERADVLHAFVHRAMEHELLGYWVAADGVSAMAGAYGRAVERAIATGAPRDRTARLMRDAGVMLRLAACYNDALPLLRRAAAMTADADGDMARLHAELAVDVANLLQSMGDLDEAERWYRLVLDERRARLGEEHGDVARALGDLASVLEAKGSFEAAEEMYRSALRISEGAHASQQHLAGEVNNLAALLHATGRYDEAEALYRRSLAIWTSAHGPEHPNTAIAMNNLAALLCDRGNGEGARLLFDQVVRIWERALGRDHPMVATVLCNGAGQIARDDPAAALELLTRARAIHAAVFAAPTHETAIIIYSIGRAAFYAGDLQRSEREFREAYELQRALLGADHIDTALSVSGLAMVMRERGDLLVAEGLFRQALATMENAVGADHPQVGIQLGNLAELARRRGDFTGARDLAERALVTLRRLHGSGHAKVTELEALLAALPDGDAAR